MVSVFLIADKNGMCVYAPTIFDWEDALEKFPKLAALYYPGIIDSEKPVRTGPDYEDYDVEAILIETDHWQVTHKPTRHNPAPLIVVMPFMLNKDCVKMWTRRLLRIRKYVPPEVRTV